MSLLQGADFPVDEATRNSLRQVTGEVEFWNTLRNTMCMFLYVHCLSYHISYVFFLQVDPNHLKKLSFTNFVNQSIFSKKPIKALRFATVAKSSGRSGRFGFLQIRSHWRIIGRGQLGRCELWKCAPDSRNSRRNDVIRHPPMCSLDEKVGGFAEFFFPKHSVSLAMWCFCLVEIPKREIRKQKCRA